MTILEGNPNEVRSRNGDQFFMKILKWNLSIILGLILVFNFSDLFANDQPKKRSRYNGNVLKKCRVNYNYKALVGYIGPIPPVCIFKRTIPPGGLTLNSPIIGTVTKGTAYDNKFKQAQGLASKDFNLKIDNFKNTLKSRYPDYNFDDRSKFYMDKIRTDFNDICLEYKTNDLHEKSYTSWDVFPLMGVKPTNIDGPFIIDPYQAGHPSLDGHWRWEFYTSIDFLIPNSDACPDTSGKFSTSLLFNSDSKTCTHRFEYTAKVGAFGNPQVCIESITSKSNTTPATYQSQVLQGKDYTTIFNKAELEARNYFDNKIKSLKERYPNYNYTTGSWIEKNMKNSTGDLCKLYRSHASSYAIAPNTYHWENFPFESIQRGNIRIIHPRQKDSLAEEIKNDDYWKWSFYKWVELKVPSQDECPNFEGN